MFYSDINRKFEIQDSDRNYLISMNESTEKLSCTSTSNIKFFTSFLIKTKGNSWANELSFISCPSLKTGRGYSK